VLPEIDRLEMDHLLADLEQAEKRLKDLEQVIARRSAGSKEVAVLSSMPGVGRGFTALSLACRVDRVERFPRAQSLANYWGLTPGCRNSGESDQRLGRITKAGSSTARWLLAQLVHKVLRRDARLREWFRRVKRRRGGHGRPRGGDAQARDYHLAHAELAGDVREVSEDSGGLRAAWAQSALTKKQEGKPADRRSGCSIRAATGTYDRVPPAPPRHPLPRRQPPGLDRLVVDKPLQVLRQLVR
jgi:hypothetical protein